MRVFVTKHPHLTQFLVLAGVIILIIPTWGLFWFGVLELARILITEGCQARGYSCEYESGTVVIVSLVFIPFFFGAFVYAANKISGLITNRLLRWAGLNPDVALS